MSQSRRNLAVSKIAAYAEDPSKFIAAKGMPYNALAARIGTASHNRIGRQSLKPIIVVIVVILGFVAIKMMGLVG